VPTSAWVEQRHPQYNFWRATEKSQRASYIARRKDLVPYLVPYIFEITDENEGDPTKLARGDLGYGLSVNESYLSDILGHVRNAASSYSWGLLADEEPDVATSGAPPAGTVALSIWEDATNTNVSWRNFFLRKVLEWQLTSPGGFVIVDAPQGRPQSAAQDAQFRPYLRFVQSSFLLDAGRSRNGFRWMKFVESIDERTWDDEGGEFTLRYLVYSLEGPEDEAHTVVRRFTEKGDPIVPEVPDDQLTEDGQGIDLGVFVDRQGTPTLPIVPATFGEHPDVPWLGSGLLMGLDDIVIDIFNTVSEMREGYRDEVWSPFVHVGPEPSSVRDLIVGGSKFIALGDEDNVSLTRLTADAAAVDSGMAQVKIALDAWQESAKRKAADAQAREMSGIALQADFQLSLAPLLREVAETLDDVESGVMWIVAQFVDREARVSDLAGMGVERNRDFRPEEEASRINRIVGDATKSFGRFPSAEALSEAFMRMVESSDMIDLDETIQVGQGEGAEQVSRRELIQRQVRDGFSQMIEAQRNRDQGGVPLAFGG